MCGLTLAEWAKVCETIKSTGFSAADAAALATGGPAMSEQDDIADFNEKMDRVSRRNDFILITVLFVIGLVLSLALNGASHEITRLKAQCEVKR